MKKIICIVLIAAAFTSCKKDTIISKPIDAGKTYFRVQEVDNDGAVQYSSTISAYIKS